MLLHNITFSITNASNHIQEFNSTSSPDSTPHAPTQTTVTVTKLITSDEIVEPAVTGRKIYICIFRNCKFMIVILLMFLIDKTL